MENNFIPVNSSMIKEVQYLQGVNALLVRFHNDSVYRYTGVTNRLYKVMMSAESVSKFFIVNIKTLPCTKME